MIGRLSELIPLIDRKGFEHKMVVYGGRAVGMV